MKSNGHTVKPLVLDIPASFVRKYQSVARRLNIAPDHMLEDLRSWALSDGTIEWSNMLMGYIYPNRDEAARGVHGYMKRFPGTATITASYLVDGKRVDETFANPDEEAVRAKHEAFRLRCERAHAEEMKRTTPHVTLRLGSRPSLKITSATGETLLHLPRMGQRFAAKLRRESRDVLRRAYVQLGRMLDGQEVASCA